MGCDDCTCGDQACNPNARELIELLQRDDPTQHHQA